MSNQMNLSASSSFSSNKSFSSTSSSSIKDNSVQQQQHQHQNPQNKRVVVILNNDPNKKFKEIKSSSNYPNPIYRHSMSFPTVPTYQSTQPAIEDPSLNTVPTDEQQFSDKSSTSSGYKTCEESNLEPLALVEQVQASGVVKNLRKKFLPDSYTNTPPINYNVINRGRSRSELVSNFQLKKCQSVILNVSPTVEKKNSLLLKKLDEKNVSTLNMSMWKKTRSNNFLNELCDFDAKDEANSVAKTEDKLLLNSLNNPLSLRYGASKERFTELSMFQNVNIKEKINKFSHNLEQSNLSKKTSNLRHPLQTPQMRYGGSCNNLLSAFSPHRPTDTLKATSHLSTEFDSQQSDTNTKSSITSDTEASTDESCSDDLTSTSLSDNNMPVPTQVKNNLHITNIHVESNRPSIPPKYRTELNVQQNSFLVNNRSSNRHLGVFENDGDFNNKITTTRSNSSLTINVTNPHYNRCFESNNPIDKSSMNPFPQFNPIKFDEDYKKIKDAFDDLKKDNEFIEKLLNDVRSKVKETTVSVVDSFLAQNFYDLSNGVEVANQLATLRDSTNYPNNFNDMKSTNKDIVGLEKIKLLQPKENNFVNSKLLEFESKMLNNNSSAQFPSSLAKSPFKNKLIQLMPNDPNIQQVIRHKF